MTPDNCHHQEVRPCPPVEPRDLEPTQISPEVLYKPDELHARAKLDPVTVNKYSRMLDKLDPVWVVMVSGTPWLVDGHHRVAAVKKGNSVSARVEVGDRTHAIRCIVSANTRHGLRMKNADKQKAVDIALRESRTVADKIIWSNQCIADLVGVSAEMVRKRSKLLDRTGTANILGKDNRVYPQKAASVFAENSRAFTGIGPENSIFHQCMTLVPEAVPVTAETPLVDTESIRKELGQLRRFVVKRLTWTDTALCADISADVRRQAWMQLQALDHCLRTPYIVFESLDGHGRRGIGG